MGRVVLAASIGWSAHSASAQLQPPDPVLRSPSTTNAVPADNSSGLPAPTAPAHSVASSAGNVQPGEQVFQINASHTKINLRNLDTRVLELGNRIKIVDGFDPEKVSIKALSPHRVRMHASQPGVTTVKLIDEFDKIHVVDVFVEPDTRELEAYLLRLFPGSAIEVIGIRDGVVLRGWVTEPTQIPQIMAIAEQFYEIVHPQLIVAGASQVQLHVKVMEVQRSKLRQLGFNFLMAGQNYYVHNGVGSLAPLAGIAKTAAAATVPGAQAGLITPPSFLPTFGAPALQNSTMNFAIAGDNNVFQGFLEAMQTEQLAKILAEPILVTTSGRPATVHSGGEFPVLVPQSFGNLSIQWREFGVRLEAVPIVLGEGRLRLDLAPEVSERDFSNSVSINGLVVPGITSRSVNTQVEMRFGETLMIGGLISTRELGTTQKVPFLGELPWIGAAFSRKSYTQGETELVILVTPQMVSPMLPHQVPAGGPGTNTAIPTNHELYFDGNLEVPRYGPDCPGCEPGPGLILPGGAPAANGDYCEPTPATPLLGEKTKAQQEILPASGTVLVEPRSKTTVVNPFHAGGSPKASGSSQEKPGAPRPATSKIQQVSATEREMGQEVAKEKEPASEVETPQPKSKPSFFDPRSLPGLILPKSSSKTP